MKFPYEPILVNRTNYQAISLMSKVFAYGPGDPSSIPGRVIPKSQKMVLDSALLNTQKYNLRINRRVEKIQGME